MGQIRECTVCARRMYSLAEKNWYCTVDGCKAKGGIMRLVTIEDRSRYVYRGDGTKMGEFW